MYSMNLEDLPLLASPQPHVGSSSLTTSELTSLCLQRASSAPSLSINTTERRLTTEDKFPLELFPGTKVKRSPWPPTPPFPSHKLNSRKCSEESEVFLMLTSEQEMEIARFLQNLDESGSSQRGSRSPHSNVADVTPFKGSRREPSKRSSSSCLQTPRPPLPQEARKSLSARSSPGLSDILTTASASEVSSANESFFENWAVRTYDPALQKDGCIASPWSENPILARAEGYYYSTGDELEDSCVPRLACRFCGRQFRQDRVATHQEICQRTAGSRKRHVSEPRVQQARSVKVTTGSRVPSNRRTLSSFPTQPSRSNRLSSGPPSSFSECGLLNTPENWSHQNVGMHSNDGQVITQSLRNTSNVKVVALNPSMAAQVYSAKDQALSNLRPAPELPKWMSKECDTSPAPAWWESRPKTEAAGCVNKPYDSLHVSEHLPPTSAVSSLREGCRQARVHDHGMFGDLMTEVAELNEQVDRMLSRRAKLFEGSPQKSDFD